MHQKALVTGGAGFIGSNLARTLLAEGLDVTILDDLSMGKEENIPDSAEFILGDVRSQEDVTKALQDVSVVFHEAARVSIRSSVKNFYQDAETNLMGTLNLLQCCSGSAVRKIIMASSMAVYADCEFPEPISEDYSTESISPYGISKLAAEKYCMRFAEDEGIDCHVLRYFNTYGPGQTFTPYVGVITIFIRQLLSGQSPKIYGDGEQRRDFVHVSDIVAANMLSLHSDSPSGIFNVGTGRSTSVNEIAHMLRLKINEGISFDHVEAHPGELRYSIADLSRISSAFGYQPVVQLSDRIGELIDIHRQKFNDEH